MEKFRLGQTPTMTFCATGNRPCQLAAGWTPRAPGACTAWTMGPNGLLPLHYTELALKLPFRESSRSDAGSIFPIFSPPLADAVLAGIMQSPVRWCGGYCKPEHDRFAFYIASISGQDLRKAPKARCQIMFARRPPPIWYANRATLTGWPLTLAQSLFQRAFAVKEFALHWITVADDEITRSGTPAQSSVLGTGRLSYRRTGICSTNSG